MGWGPSLSRLYYKLKGVMRKALCAKFSQNPQLMTLYRQFADKTLIHEVLALFALCGIWGNKMF